MTTGLTGILNASFEVMSRLRLAGYEVVSASPQPVGEAVRAQGFEYLQLLPVNRDPAPEVPIFKGFFKKTRRLLYKWIHRNERQKVAIESLGMDDFSKKIEEIKPDLWLVDVELHEHIMTLVAKNEPVLLLSQWFSLWRREGLPPLSRNTIPGVGSQGTSEVLNATWDRLEANRNKMFLKKEFLSGGTDRRSILKKYAAQIGFDEKYIPDNYWPGPFVYSELPVIAMTAEELEFPHDKTSNLQYVGSMVYEDRLDTSTEEWTTKKLNQIFKQKQTTDKKLLYCSVSTFRGGDLEFLKKVVAAVASSDWILILGLGGKIDANTLNPLPENVFAFGRVPQLDVLAKADLSINHGGIHTINECVHFEVPMLVYSGKRSDQNGCAARVHYHQIGLMADKDEDDVATIQEKIEKVLSEPIFKKNIEIFSKKIDRYKKEKTLEHIVKSHVAK